MSDTIARMAAFRARLKDAGDPGGEDRLAELTGFGSNPGALRAKTYVPANLPKGAPLVVVLHGCTQSAEAYDNGAGWSALADRHGFAVLYPQQQRANNPNLCFNWFVPDDTRRDSGEVLSIRQMIAATVSANAIDENRIFVTGLSAGGAMTMAMLATYPELFAGGAVIAGLPYDSARSVPEAFDRMRGHGGPSAGELQGRARAATDHDGPWPTLSVWQGSADYTVVPANADAIVGQWRGLHGLPAKPSRVETVDGQQRRIWCDADGREIIDAYAIAGMAHGTPIAPSAPDGVGRAGPYMLDVGISSSTRIAAFWGIGGTTAKRPTKKPTRGALAVRDDVRPLRPDPEPASHAKKAPAKTVGVGKVIEDALRKAGLMR